MKAKYLVLVLLTGFASVEAAAQSALPRKDIPAIVKAANGAIVTIVLANDDKPIAQGTGFIVNPDGVIVTNYHVIKTGNVAVVKFSDGAVFAVDGVLAADKDRDLAVIKIHGRTFHTLVLGNSNQIQVGEEVVAIGNPLGFELTVSNGILSGVRTDKEAGGKFLQVTAPITHGSSGGPLFNMMGEVVGITTLGFEGGGNLNFAIPVNDAKRLLSNQSVVLRNLPNEAEPVQVQKHDGDAPQGLATLSEQKMCMERAEQRLDEYKKNPFVSVAEYTSHYDAGTSRCYVEISNHTYFEGQEILHNRFIKDAFEGRDFGALVSPRKNEREPQLCYVEPPGQPTKTCRSEEEFNALVLKYFGTTPN